MFRTSKVRQLGIALIASMALFFSAVACSDDSSTPSQDTTSGNTDTGGGNKDGGGSDTGGGGGDAGTPATALKVAAIQFGSDQFGQVNNCGTTICALSELITNAAKNGAKIIVTPEYAFGQKTAEVSPDQGVCMFDARQFDGAAPNIGAPCRAAVECVAPEGLEAFCISAVDLTGGQTSYVGGMCVALGCGASSPCGDGAVCAIGGPLPYCLPSCEAGCRDGYACDDAVGGCVPAEAP